MAFTEYEYDAADSELYQTNLYGGSDADLDNTAPVSDSDGYTSNIDLTQKDYCIIDFKFTGSGATDDLILKLFKRRNSTWDGDEIAIDEVNVANDGSEDIYPYTIGPSHGPGHYRFSLQSAGATDTFDIDSQCRYSRYEHPAA